MVFLTRRKGFVSSINEEVCLDEKEEIILYCLKMREDILRYQETQQHQ